MICVTDEPTAVLLDADQAELALKPARTRVWVAVGLASEVKTPGNNTGPKPSLVWSPPHSEAHAKVYLTVLTDLRDARQELRRDDRPHCLDHLATSPSKGAR